MITSLKKLTYHLFDYAGCHSPESLSFATALNEYKEILGKDLHAITAKFVCPIEKISELNLFLNQTQPEKPWKIAVISKTLENALEELKSLEDFSSTYNGATLESFEIKGSALTLQESKALKPLLKGIDIAKEIFVEIPWNKNTIDSLHTLAELSSFGAKARLVGEDPESIPSVHEMACFLQECINIDLPFKFTAGHLCLLYAQTRIQNKPIHGFLNILVAGALAEAHDFTVHEIEQVLLEDNPNAFVFDKHQFGWKEFFAPEILAENFRHLLTSIESYSLTKPWNQLNSFNLVNEEKNL